MKKDILIMALAFSLIFFSFNTAQQYFAAIYSDFGMAQVASLSLAVTYLFFVIGAFFAPGFISRTGLKKALIISSVAYALFVAAIPSVNPLLLMIAAIINGLSAGVLWTAQAMYVTKSTTIKERPVTYGIFNALFLGASFIGILASSFIITLIGFKALFYIMAAVSLLGTGTLFFIAEHPETIPRTHIKELLHIFRTKAIFLIPAIIVANISFGFFVSAISLHMKEINGIAFAGQIGSLYWISEIFSALVIGYIAQHIGTRNTLKIMCLILIAGSLLLLTGSMIGFIAGAVMAGLYFSAIITAGMTEVSTLEGKDHDKAAFFQIVLASGAIVSLLVGAVISFEMANISTAILAAISFVLLFFMK